MLKRIINGYNPPLSLRVNRIIQLLFIVSVFFLGYYLGHRISDNDDGKLTMYLRNKKGDCKLTYIRGCETSSKTDQSYAPCSIDNDKQLLTNFDRTSHGPDVQNQNVNSTSVVAKDIDHRIYDLVIVIPSAVNNSGRRKAIRETWLRLQNNSEISMKHFFIIGTEDVELHRQDELFNEQREFKDLMILSTCANDFSQLTKKLLTSYYWLVKTMTFNYLLKVDDDSFARLDLLSQELRSIMADYNDIPDQSDTKNEQSSTSSFQNYRPKENSQKMLYWGYFDGRAPVFKTGKWGEKKWFLCNSYLPYALGGGYIVSSDIVNILASLSPYLQLYLNEDVSMGVWLAPFANINRKHDRRFDTEATPRGCSNQHIISHHLTIDEIYSRYNNLIKGNYYCSSQYQSRFSYEYNWNALPSDCCRRGFRDY